MSQTNDLTPSIDAVVEQETIGFDYGPLLEDGVKIQSVLQMTVVVEENSTANDSDPNSRLLTLPQVIPSKATGAVECGVGVLFGTAIADVTYVIQCVVVTTDNQRLSLWTRFLCMAPF